MQLRNAHLAIVERHKLLDYLLNASHPDNGGKAKFFESLAFTSENLELLAGALHAVAETGEVVERVESTHGENMLWMEGYRRTLRRTATGWSGPFGSSIEARRRLAWSRPILEGSEHSS